MPDTSCLREASIELVIMTQGQPRPARVVPPRQTTIQAFGQIRHTQLPTARSDVDAAMARAMLAVISSSSSPQQSQARRPWGAFGPYADPSPVPKTEAMQVLQGQRMMKRAFSILRQIKAPVDQEMITSQGSNQWNHVMSERKRREKLNESFAALRESLPPGTKVHKCAC